MRVTLEHADHDNALRRQAELAYSGQMRFSGAQAGKGGVSAPGKLPEGLNLELGALSGLPFSEEKRAGEKTTAGVGDALAGLQNKQDYMTLMGHIASDEDFGRMLKEGADPSSMDIKESVTNLDRIKLALAKGGTEVAGFTDELSVEKLASMTGSRGFAESLAQEFTRTDLPLDDETLQGASEAFLKARTMPEGKVPDQAAAYLAEEGLEPGVDNLYQALHSGRMAGRGSASYYQETNGYVTKAGELKEWDAPEMEGLLRQAEEVISKAGLPVTDEYREASAFLIREGIPLTPESLERFSRIRQMELPGQERETELAKAVAAAVSEGKEPGEAVFGSTETIYEKAIRINEEYQAIDPERFGEDPASFGYKPSDISAEALSYEEVDARLTLVNVQLKMSAQANLVLMRSGFSIETAPLEELARKLGEARQELYPGLDEEQIALAEKTLDTVSQMPRWPIAISGFYAVHREISVSGLSAAAVSMQITYERAGAAYETMLTTPRSDLGDSIRTAFRNADELLKEAGYSEPTEELRRAVRILGYNEMEIRPENIERVRAADQELKDLMKELKPSRLISMIREGKNPMELSAEGLKSELGARQEEPPEEKEEKSYSAFLYGLQKKKELSSEERQEYMEVYRFLTRLERDDGAAIGFLLKAGSELSFSNLRSAMRSEKKKGMDYRVDESFGGLELKIAEKQELVRETREAFTPALPQEKLPKEETTLEEFAKELEHIPPEAAQAMEREYAAEQAETMREAAAFSATSSGEAAMELLQELELPSSPEQLFATELLQNTAEFLASLQKWVKPAEIKKEDEEEPFSFDLNRFTDPESAAEEEEELSERISEALPDALEQEEHSGLRELNTLRNALRISVRAASREEYQIPLQTEGGAAAARVRFLKGEEKGRIRISAWSETLGKLEAAIRVSVSGELKGEVVTDRRDILPVLQERLGGLAEEAGTPAVGLKALFRASGEPVESPDPEFVPEERAGVLYRMAGSFLQAVLVA